MMSVTWSMFHKEPVTLNRVTCTTRATPTKLAHVGVSASSLKRSAYWSAHLLGRLIIPRERLAPRRVPGLRRLLLLLMPMLQQLQSSLPGLIRLIVLILLQHSTLLSPLRLLISQTGVVSRVIIKYMLMLRFRMTRGSWLGPRHSSTGSH